MAFPGKTPEVKVVALIPTSSTISLNPLWASLFLRKNDLSVRVNSENSFGKPTEVHTIQ